MKVFGMTFGKGAVGAGLASLALVAGNAAAVADVSGATGAFTEAGTAIGTVGAAMVIAAGAGIVYKWVTAFLI